MESEWPCLLAEYANLRPPLLVLPAPGSEGAPSAGPLNPGLAADLFSYPTVWARPWFGLLVRASARLWDSSKSRMKAHRPAAGV